MTKHSTSWNDIAAEYARGFTSADSYHANVILPNLLRVVNPKQGMRILEVGCGDGFFANAFAELGADVLGVDIAEDMIAIAGSRSSGARFSVATAEALPGEAQSYDAVVMALSLQNIENVSDAIAEAARVLKKKGELIVVLNHPAFRIPKRSMWGWDEQRDIQFRRIDGYLSDSKEKIDMDPGSNEEKRFTVSFHRPLQVYIKTLTKHGFVITGLEEWISNRTSVGKRAEAENRARSEFPLFLMLRAQKM